MRDDIGSVWSWKISISMRWKNSIEQMKVISSHVKGDIYAVRQMEDDTKEE